MLVAGSISPRTHSRLDPTLKKEKGRPCRQHAPEQPSPIALIATNSLASIAANTVDQNGLFLISQAQAAYEELEGNRRVHSPGEISSKGRDSPFHGYFPKIPRDILDVETDERVGSVSQGYSGKDQFFRPHTSPASITLTPTERKASPTISRTVNRVVSRVDSHLQSSSSESVALPPSRPPTPVTLRDGKRRRPHSRASLYSPDGSEKSIRRRSPYTPRSSATLSRPQSVATTNLPNLEDHEEHNIIHCHFRPKDVVSLAEADESQKILRRKQISSAMLFRQHSRGPRSIPGEHFSGKRLRMESRRRSVHPDMEFNERACIRSESVLNEDIWDSFNDLSRECCDVLGPRHCYDCEKLYKRVDASSRNLESFPKNMGAEQLAIMNVVRRMYPDLSPLEVYHRIEMGDISVPSLKRDTKAHDRVKSSKSNGAKSRHTGLNRKPSISAFNIPDGIGFFANIADLRTQLLKKQGGRAGHKNLFQELVNNQAAAPAVEEDVLLLPKQEVDWENPANYFTPPLLSRAEIRRQQSQPRFYAGENKKSYALPLAPDVDTLASRNLQAVKKIQNELASFKEAKSEADDDFWATKKRTHSARSCMTTSTLDTEAVCTEAFDQMSVRSEAGTLDDVEGEDDNEDDTNATASQKDDSDDDGSLYM